MPAPVNAGATVVEMAMEGTTQAVVNQAGGTINRLIDNNGEDLDLFGDGSPVRGLKREKLKEEKFLKNVVK